jgi:hypothetical protein
MRDGRFNTSKCRDKLQKIKVRCTHPQSSPGPCNMQGPLTLEGQLRPKTGRCHFLTFHISLFGESIEHETIFGGR